MKSPYFSSAMPVIAALLLLIAAASAVAVTLGDRPPAPEDRQNIVIPLEGIGIDFGAVDAGETVAGSVTLVNNGEKPVHVLAAKASCGCTTLPAFKPLTLEPGAKSRIELSVEAPGKPGLRKVRHIIFKMQDRDDLKVPLVIETLGEGDA